LLKDLEEIWTQNSMTGRTDHASTMRALVREESAIAFEATLDKAMSDVDGVATCTTTEHVATALQAVTSTVFPFQALEMQQQWMQRRTHKLADLSTRQMAEAINKLNNALPLFPLGSTESKFSENR
jgi:cob(I)alamin adenosyltransferase